MQKPKKEKGCRVYQRWTNEELQKLKEIHDQQRKYGKDKLWARIAEVFSRKVREVTRHNLEYKWKNYVAQQDKSTNKISDNEELKDQLMMAAPFKGFPQLSREEPFNTITENNLKNAFYQAVGLIAHTLSFMDAKTNAKQVQNMLKDRRFLLMLAQKGIFLANLRRNSIALKAVIKRMRGMKDLHGDELEVVADLREKMQTQFHLIKNLHHSCIGSKSQPLEQNLEEEQVDEEQPNDYMLNLSGIPSILSMAAEPAEQPAQQPKHSIKLVSQVYDSKREFYRPYISNHSFSWDMRDI